MNRGASHWWGETALALAAVASLGCMVTPRDGVPVASTKDPISFSGDLLTPGDLVHVRASQKVKGPWTTIGAATSSTTPATLNSTVLVYKWAVTAEIPSPLWTDDVDADGCPQRAVYVSAENRGTALGVSNASMTSVQDYLRLLGYLPLMAPAGGLVVATQADADLLRCARVIVGNLSVVDSTDDAISLPNLERVTGNLTVSYPSRTIPGATAQDPSCEESRQFRAPALSDVGGDVALQVKTSHDFENVDVGLPALTHVGGDLSVTATGAPDISVAGLDQLASVPGNVALSFDHDTGCYVAGNSVGIDGACVPAPARPPLLDALTSVGSATVSTVIESYCILRNLTHVTHDLVMRTHLPGHGFLDKLQDVGGDLRFETGTEGGVWTPPSPLASVGRIVVTSTTITNWPLNLNSPPTVGGIDIEGSSLANLNGASATLQPATAPVTIQNNTNLPTSQVCAFVKAIGAVNPTLDTGVTCP